MFFKCDCGQEAIHIERDLELLDAPLYPKGYECLIYFSIYHYGIDSHKPTLKEKLRHCWQIMKTGKNYPDQIILTQDIAEQLGKYILGLVSKESISKEIQND